MGCCIQLLLKIHDTFVELCGVKSLSMLLFLFFHRDSVDIVRVVDPAIVSNGALFKVLLTHELILPISQPFKGIVALRFLSLPHVRHVEVLLKRHHLVDELLLEIHVLLLDLLQGPGIINLIWVNCPHILAFNRLVVLTIVFDVLLLQGLDDTFEVSFRANDLLFGECLLRDIPVIEVDSHVFILHVKVSTNSRVGHDLLKLFLLCILDFVAIEHRDGSDVL